MQLTKKGDRMIGSTIEMNDSVYLKVPITLEAIHKNKYEMLQYNNIKGIINFDRRYFNDACYLTYNLDTYVSLKSLKKQNRLQDYQLIEILSQINEIIQSLEDYFLLEAKDFVMTIDNIYYDFYQKRIFMIYLPINEEKSLAKKYKLLLLNVLENMPLERKHSAIMNALHGFVDGDDFSISGLNDLIKNLMVGDYKVNETDEKKDHEDIFFKKTHSLADSVVTKPTQENISTDKSLVLDIIRGIALESIGLLTMNLIIRFFEISNQLNQLAVVLLIQLLTFITIYLVVLKEYYGFERIKKYLKSKNDYKKRTLAKDNIFASTNKPLESIAEEEITYNTSTVIQGVVEEVYPSKAYLLKKDLKSEEKIYITDKSFILGRQVEVTDYHINDSKISKRHLEVLDIDEELFIRDLNSTNGTYLNDEKLDPNRLTKIFDGDLIKMATLVYEFKIE